MNWVLPLVAGVGVLLALWPTAGTVRSPDRIEPQRPESAHSADRGREVTPMRGEAALLRPGIWRRRPDRGSVRDGAAAPPGSVAGCCDLLSVAIASGCSTAEAVREVGRSPGAGSALAESAAALERGMPFDAAMEQLGSAPGGWYSLATLLAVSSASGANATDSLRRLAASERLRMRRVRETRARRLPVLLLLPLTAMVLPAFLLVTVVPFVVAGADFFELPPLPEQNGTPGLPGGG